MQEVGKLPSTRGSLAVDHLLGPENSISLIAGGRYHPPPYHRVAAHNGRSPSAAGPTTLNQEKSAMHITVNFKQRQPRR